jgi:hypothetical protein
MNSELRHLQINVLFLFYYELLIKLISALFPFPNDLMIPSVQYTDSHKYFST